jgi:hypothetical protein
MRSFGTPPCSSRSSDRAAVSAPLLSWLIDPMEYTQPNAVGSVVPPNDIPRWSSVTHTATYVSGFERHDAMAALAEATKPALSLSTTFVWRMRDGSPGRSDGSVQDALAGPARLMGGGRRTRASVGVVHDSRRERQQ